ncbi:MAG: PspC domain-containing protein [Bacteroidetes bacterium]|uniref:PspC domain-containing protein n=1 Tax=Candidatus Cryptobacteroides faecipullorum TaxID=2840764 RepID=A0A9D9IAM5_9BACT|nr:PspC domain-containing protein [Candidatus Cryptobacteroides faecipullorum]
MKQTEKVSIGGYSFILERDAYERLNGYIEDIRSTYRGNSYSAEILSDIEQRIAELFIEKGGKDSVVSYGMVDDVIIRIGSPAELADEEKAESEMSGRSGKQNGGGGTVYPYGPKRLYRDLDHRTLGGVCSGIAAYFNVDAVLVRLIFTGLTLLAGIIIADWYMQMVPVIMAALAFYMLLWLIIPAAKTVEEKCRMRGEPIDLRQFKEKFDRLPFNETVEEIKTSPALHSAGRVVSIITGIILIIAGIGSLIGCSVYDLVRDLIEKEADLGSLGYYDDEQIFLSQFVLRDEFWWMCIAVVGLFAVWLIYNGTLLTFNLRSPRWRPGTIIFILWIISMLVFAAWVIRRLLIIGTLM